MGFQFLEAAVEFWAVLLFFCSGVIGSGLAIFSKYRVQDAFLYRYSLNGYPYMVSHYNNLPQELQNKASSLL